jgi:hypothetical protein
VHKLIESLNIVIDEANEVKSFPEILKPLQSVVMKYIDVFKSVTNKSKATVTKEDEDNILNALDTFESDLSKYEKGIEEDISPEIVEAKSILTRYKEAVARLRNWVYNNRFKGLDIPKSALSNILNGFYGVFSDIIGAELSQSLIKTIANSNPLTKLAYDNKELITAPINAVSKIGNKNA